MKLKVADVLKRAILTNDMPLVAKVYEALTGDKLNYVPPTPPKTAVDSQKSTTNLFSDDGTLAKEDSPRSNPQISKLYNTPTQRREAVQPSTLHCTVCRRPYVLSPHIAAQYTDDPQNTKLALFKCDNCILRK